MLNCQQSSHSKEQSIELSILSKTKLFEGCSLDQLKGISKISCIERHLADESIYTLGERADTFYILSQGMVHFAMGSTKQQISHGYILHQGEVFGWAALSEVLTTRIATATCLMESMTLAIKGSQLRRLMDVDRCLGYRLLRTINTLIASSVTAFIVS